MKCPRLRPRGSRVVKKDPLRSQAWKVWEPLVDNHKIHNNVCQRDMFIELQVYFKKWLRLVLCCVVLVGWSVIQADGYCLRTRSDVCLQEILFRFITRNTTICVDQWLAPLCGRTSEADRLCVRAKALQLTRSSEKSRAPPRNGNSWRQQM